MFRSIAITTAAAMTCALLATESAQAQATTSAPGQKTETAQAPATESPQKEVWHGPFGGTFTAGAALVTDYSYRGLSQTQRSIAFQPTMTYETPTVSENIPLSAYVGFWGSNVNFPGSGAIVEIDLDAGFRFKAFDDKFTADLGYIRYNYPGSNGNLGYDFNEFGLVLGYDFGFVALQGALRYSPNFFGNSGIAWYKWAQATVPLPFINFNLFGDPVVAKLFGTIGSQYVERNVNYGIPNNDYWDWQLGATVTVYGVDLTLSYVGTNIDYAGCLNTYNCEDRVIFSVSKTF